MPVENIEEVQAFIEANKDNPKVVGYVGGLVTPDRVAAYLDSEEGKKLLQPKLDTYASKAITTHDEKFKLNELPKLINEAVAKANPQETPEQKKIRELEERINQSDSAKAKSELTNQALKIMQDKKLPTNLAEYFIGKDEATTIANLSALEQVFNTNVESLVAERLGKGYQPPTSGAKLTDTNPWSKEHFNLTEQGKIMVENPSLAGQLMAQAKV